MAGLGSISQYEENKSMEEYLLDSVEEDYEDTG